MSTLRDLSRREFHVDYNAIPPWISKHRINVLIGIGIVLRVAQYLANRSYWLDESALAGNIRLKTFLGLFGPLTSTQLAPPGFLAIEWVACRILGDNPFSLRLLPLVGGIASLFLFRRLAEKLLRPGAVAIAVALFAFCDDLIYFSSELKQYSTDVAIGLVCTLEGLETASRPSSRSQMTRLAIVGGVAVWFSHTAAFVIAGVGTVLFLRALLLSAAGSRLSAPSQQAASESLAPSTYSLQPIAWLIPVGMLWAASVAAVREVSWRQLGGRHRFDMWAFWNFAFPQWPFTSIDQVFWPIHRGLYLLVNPLDYYWPLNPRFMIILPTILLLGGCASLVRRTPTGFALLTSPAAFALLATYLGLFPFHGRLVLFLVPAILLAIAEGAGWASEAVGDRWFRAVLVGSLLLFPVLGDLYHVAVPRFREGINPFGDRRPYPDPEKHPGFHPDRFPF